MSQHGDQGLTARILCRWVEAVGEHGASVAWACCGLTLALAVYTALNLGINSDNMSLISDRLPSQQWHREFSSLFPNLNDAILVVIDGETPELTRSATEAMEAALKRQPDRFTQVYQPGGGDFFERHGLLYRSPDDLYEFSDQMASMQPVMAQLERDPSISQLAEIVRLALEDLRERNTGAREWSQVFERVSQATLDVYREFPIATSWEEILLRGSSIDVSTRRILITQPVLESAQLLGAGRAIDAIHDVARGMGLVAERGVRVRVTGNPALNYEEMIGLMWDIAGAGLFCFVLVATMVFVALRSFRLMTAVLVTLLVGLVWTAAFAAASVGHLNLISISFAVLYIGLGVDFGIHFGMGYASHIRAGEPHATALQSAAGSIGPSLALCSLTTAIGFAVFVPTDYRGIAELGLIASGGMFVILLLFLTLFPALLSSWLRLDSADSLRGDLHFRLDWWEPFQRRPGAVLLVAVIAFVGSLALLPRNRFDPNVIDMRDPGTESVEAFNDLLSKPGTAPWYINVVEPDLPRAQALAEQIRKLETVESAITLADFVPDEQGEKLEILGDIAMLLDVPAGSATSDPELSTEKQIGAIRELHDFFGAAWMQDWNSEDGALLEASIEKLRTHLADFLSRIEREENAEEALADLEEVLFAGLPDQIARLRTAVNTGPIESDDLPTELSLRMLAPDGRARVQIFPSRDLSDLEAMKEFVAEVKAIAPGATSVVVNLIEFGDVTVSAFVQALLSAAVVIFALLFGIWRSLRDSALAMAPLLLVPR